MIIQHNIQAINSHRQLSINTTQVSKNLEKLSSGYRINRAGDDAAGLAISERMRGQIQGLSKAEENVSHGINLIQTAEGAMNEIHALLHRGRELTVQAANGTYQDEDRGMIQLEIDQVTLEIDRIASYTNYNGMNIFDLAGLFNLSKMDQVAAGTRTLYSAFGSVSTKTTGTGVSSVADMEAAMGVYADPVINSRDDLKEYLETQWLPNAINQIMATFDSFADVDITIHIAFDRDINPAYTGTNPTGIAYYSYVDDSAGLAMTKHVVVLDLDEFLDHKDISLDYLDRIVAHELMHVLMAEVAPAYVTSSGRDAWFMEGTAEMVSGGMDHIAGMSITDIANAFGDDSGVYSSGYFASCYLSWLVATNKTTYDNTPVTAELLAEGLDKILNEMRDGNSLDDAIKNLLPGYGLSDLETAIRTAGVGSDADNFLTSLRAAAGPRGTGSVIAGAGTAAGYDLAYEGRYVVGNNQATNNHSNITFNFDLLSLDGDLWIQTGANAGEGIYIQIGSVSTASLGVDNIDIRNATTEDRDKAIESYDSAIQKLSRSRARLGAMQNRLEHTLNNLGVTKENLISAESSIRDADMAKLMMSYTKNSILVQASQAMLAQATQLPQGVLALLG